MLERFHVPAGQEVRVDADALRRTVAGIFEACGVPADEAATGADVLVSTDLRGVETHGVSNMLRRYVEWYRDGTLNPRPAVRVERETRGTATLDGDGGLGIIQGPPAMQLAIEKARDVGVGVVVMHNSGHLGAVGHHAMLAAREDMAGVCMTAAGYLVLPTFGAEPRFGTNPIAYAVPARSEPFLLFDAATSAIAGNKIGLAQRLGVPLEPGWIAGPDGAPVLERAHTPESGDYHLLPLGGTREQGSHKGYGLALMVEVLSTLLAGAVPAMVDRPQGLTCAHYFAAYNIAAFTDVATFKDTMDRTLQTLTATPPAPGHERVIYPGILEHEAETDRLAHGIPLHPEVVEWFDTATEEMGLAQLERM